MTAYFQAARDIYQMLLYGLKDEQGVHAESAVAALSAVCGEELLRACHVDLSQFPPGGFVIVDQINDSGPRLLGYLEELLAQLGVDHGDNWSGKVPPEYQPLKEPLQLAAILRPQMQNLLEKHKLNETQAAHAACMALAILIRDCSPVLPARISVLIAANTIMRAAKSVPVAS